MMLRWDDKDPNEVLDYVVDWRQRRLDDDDVIAASIWVVPDGITKTDDSFTADQAVIWLSGGTAGESYVLTNRITTSAGRVMDQSVRLKVSNK